MQKQRHYFANRRPSSQGYGFSCGHVWMWELDCEESWALKNWCFWTVVLEKTLKSLLDCKEIQPVHPKGDQSWVFIGRTDAEAETPILWPPHAKNWLIGKDPDAGRDWGQEDKGTTEDEIAGWHHRLDGCEFEWIPGHGDGQGGLACCDSWGCKESDTTERLNWTERKENFLGRFIIENVFKCSLPSLSPAEISLTSSVHTGSLGSFISDPFLISFAFLSSNINPGGFQASPVVPMPSRSDGHILHPMGAERSFFFN